MEVGAKGRVGLVVVLTRLGTSKWLQLPPVPSLVEVGAKGGVGRVVVLTRLGTSKWLQLPPVPRRKEAWSFYRTISGARLC